MFLVGEHYAHKGNNNVTWEKNLFFPFPPLMGWKRDDERRAGNPRKTPAEKAEEKSRYIFRHDNAEGQSCNVESFHDDSYLTVCVFFFSSTRAENGRNMDEEIEKMMNAVDMG